MRVEKKRKAHKVGVEKNVEKLSKVERRAQEIRRRVLRYDSDFQIRSVNMTYMEVDAEDVLMSKYDESFNRYKKLSNERKKLIDEYKKLVNLQDHEIESSTHLKRALYLMGIIEMFDPLSEEFTELLNEINESWNKANESLNKAIELTNNGIK